MPPARLREERPSNDGISHGGQGYEGQGNRIQPFVRQLVLVLEVKDFRIWRVVHVQSSISRLSYMFLRPRVVADPYDRFIHFAP